MMLDALPTVAAPKKSSPMHRLFDEEAANEELKKLLKKKGETFQECLFRMIDDKQMKDADVYRRANMTRQHFSKIRSDVDYAPKKKTAIALALSLELSMEEARELLAKAGWTVGTSSAFDIIVGYCI